MAKNKFLQFNKLKQEQILGVVRKRKSLKHECFDNNPQRRAVPMSDVWFTERIIGS